MDNQFVDVETSKRLVGIGFNEPCLACYSPRGNRKYLLVIHGKQNNQTLYNENGNTGIIIAPLFQQAVDYLFNVCNVKANYDVDREKLHKNINNAINHYEIVLKGNLFYTEEVIAQKAIEYEKYIREGYEKASVEPISEKEIEFVICGYTRGLREKNNLL